jgi:heterodisulfide reductase subunit A-like polyferredoxin
MQNFAGRAVILHASTLWGVHPIHFSASESYSFQYVACRTRHDYLVMKKHEAIAPDLSERIVIVGGGFAGVTLAQRLERLLPTGAQFL